MCKNEDLTLGKMLFKGERVKEVGEMIYAMWKERKGKKIMEERKEKNENRENKEKNENRENTRSLDT